MPSASFKKLRVDWMPGEEALKALDELQKMHPNSHRQEVIDYAVITALDALLHKPWCPPPMPKGTRYRWCRGRQLER